MASTPAKDNTAPPPTTVGKEPLEQAGVVVARTELGYKPAPPSQHLFQQLVVSLAGAYVASGQSIDRIRPDTARNLVRAAKNLQEAIEEVNAEEQGGVRK
jgi:hypothetical protein